MAHALELVHGRHAAAQLVVLRYGRVVLDHATGCRTDSLFWIFSASKPLTAMLVHLLAQQGRLSLDNPVAEYWPDFAQHGKQAITIRHVLQHRAGVPVARSTLRDALAMGDWQRSVRALEHAQPRFPAGQVPAYHIISYGFILGELVRRACGASVPEVLADQVLGPYGLRDIHLGLPDAAWARAVPLRAPGAGGLAGQPLPRLDVPAKIDGSMRFAADVRLPGMVFAAIRQAPPGRSRLVHLDREAARAVPDLIAILDNPGWVAAVGDNGWAANRALDRLAPRFETQGGLPDTASIDGALAKALAADGHSILSHGTPDRLLGDQAIHAEYSAGLATHAALETPAATAPRMSSGM